MFGTDCAQLEVVVLSSNDKDNRSMSVQPYHS